MTVNRTSAATSRRKDVRPHGLPEVLPDLIEVHARTAGTYTIDILTASEWASLAKEDDPGDYFQHNLNTYVRFAPV